MTPPSATPALQLIVGLGNPGREHANNRHNAGFWFLDALARRIGLTFHAAPRLRAELCRWDADPLHCWLAKPCDYMNESGLAVRAVASYYKLPPERILIVHDELDVPVGALRFKEGGGLGGHNGLRSVHQQLGSLEFKRLRIGVGHPGARAQVTPWLLGDPPAAERRQLQVAIEDGLQCRAELLQGQFARVMNVLHQPRAADEAGA